MSLWLKSCVYATAEWQSTVSYAEDLLAVRANRQVACAERGIPFETSAKEAHAVKEMLAIFTDVSKFLLLAFRVLAKIYHIRMHLASLSPQDYKFYKFS